MVSFQGLVEKYCLPRITQPTSQNIRSAIQNVLNEIYIKFVHQTSLKKIRNFKNLNDLKLNLGCGPNIKEGWINIDLLENADLNLDLRKPFPFQNDSCSIIYSEHFFEHLDYPDLACSFLKECFRILKPGAIFSVVVPDIELILNSYVKGGTAEYYAAQRQWHPKWCQTQMEHINYNFRQDGEHRFCYDMETLKKLLECTGFLDVHQRQFDPELDTPERITGSLYVNCRKPS